MCTPPCPHPPLSTPSNRIRRPGEPHTAVAEACQAVVDDEALALASAWGLLPGDSLGETEGVLPGDSLGETEGVAAGAQAALSPGSTVPGVSIGAGGGAVCGGGKGREKWTPLWEALGVLSMPSVSVGAGKRLSPLSVSHQKLNP